MPVLVVRYEDGIQTFPIEEGAPLFIGRADECDVRLPSSAVSRKHAVVMCKNGICGVKDLGSFNGTMLNGQVIQTPHQLTDKDLLTISTFTMKIYMKAPNLEAAEKLDLIPPSLGPIPDSPTAKPAAKGGQSSASGTDTHKEPPTHAGGKDISPVTVKSPRPMHHREHDTVIQLPPEMNAPKPAEEEAASGPGQFRFTPFPLPPSVPSLIASPEYHGAPASDPQPGTGREERRPPTGLPETDPYDISNFQENSLAHLNMIPNNADTSGESPLAQVRSIEAPEKEMSHYSREAETIIPLIDDIPLITSLTPDTEREEGDPDYRNLSPDTATYTLPPDLSEITTGLKTGEYQSPPDTAEYRRVLDTSRYAPSPGTDAFQETGTGEYPEESATGSFRSADNERYPAAGTGGFLKSDTDEFAAEGTGEFAVTDPAAAAKGPVKAPAAGNRAIIADVGKIGSSKTSIRARSQIEGVENISISSELMSLINTRLSLYALLQDLVEERKNYQANNPDLPPEVVEELSRQDAELDNLPLADEADLLIQAMRTRQQRMTEAAHQAAAENHPIPVGASTEMRVATELAISQWLLIRDSNREALPAIYKVAYTLAAQEPLVKELTSAKISHGRLIGGAIYLLALHLLVNVANRERRRLAKAAKRLADEGLEDDEDSVLSMLGSLGRFASNLKNRGKIREEMARMVADDETNAVRAKMAGREIAFMEKTLEQEFKLLYRQVALRYIPEADTMPWYVRAFLRYGVIGFSPWWMKAEVREFITTDCEENVVLEFERGASDLQVLYADEYLYAVSMMEITPSPDENLEQLDKNSVEWKTDRAYRRIVNARSYNMLMEEMLAQLDVTINYCTTREQEFEAQINTIKTRGYHGEGENIFDLQSEQQAFAARKINLERQAERIKEEVVPSILEAIEDAEGRFRKGDLRIPDAETLISRETDALADLRRRIEGQKRVFPPMAVRDAFSMASNVINTRGAVRSKLIELEARDPNIFMNVIVPAKKKINRVELRLSPTVIIVPAYGLECICSMAREGMEGGHLLMPTAFSRTGMLQHQLTNLLADFRWNTSRNLAGRDLASSDTLAGIFAKLRWAARAWSKSKREKALFYTDVKESLNWRRIYELIISESNIGCRQLFIRNQELYDGIIDKFIDLPEGVKKIVK